MKRLDDREVFNLKSILVKDNDEAITIKVMRGYMGNGITNQSEFCAESTEEYSAEELLEREPVLIEGAEICALVNNVLYFRWKDAGGNLCTDTLEREEKGKIFKGKIIACDTVAATRVVLLLKSL